MLPADLGVELDVTCWPVPPVFELLQRLGGVETAEMYRTFNMGIGFVLIVRAEEEEQAITVLKQSGEEPVRIGRVIRGA